MIQNLPMAEARHALTSLPEQLGRQLEAVTVTRRGKPVLAILPWEVYEALVETLEILGDDRLMTVLRQGIKEANSGKGISWDRAKRRLRL